MQGRSGSDRELLDAESVAGHLVAAGSVFALLASDRARLFPESMFADLFPSRTGRPSVPSDVAASVLVLQALRGLSDRDAMEAVRTDLRWKVACGLPIGHPGYHPSTLTYWRRRLAASSAPQRVFDAVRAVVAETGVLKGRDKRALDSTVLDDAVATQDTVTQLIGAIRRVRRDVPDAAAVIAARCSAHDYDDPGKPRIAWDDEQARAVLVDALVGDAIRLLAHLPEVELGPAAAEAVGLLALVAGQDVEPGEGSDGTDGRWRIRRGVAPDRTISTVDPEARHAHKTVHRRQDGFKAHLAVEPETGIVTAVALTKASGVGADGLAVSEARTALELLEGEDGPRDVLADSAYGSGDTRQALATDKHRVFIKPAPLRPAVPDGFTYDDFTVTHDSDGAPTTVTCPNGLIRPVRAAGGATFGSACAGCPLRAHCTRSRTGRTFKVNPHDRIQRAARHEAATDTPWQDTYRTYRPMVERGVAWIVAGGNRKVRYRGVIKNNAWLHLRAAALNLRRLRTLGLTTQNGTWVLA
jgi:hypothetical protein